MTYEAASRRKLTAVTTVLVFFLGGCASTGYLNTTTNDLRTYQKPKAPQVRFTGEKQPSNEPLRITLTEAVLMGLENNRAIRVERIKPQIQQTFIEQEESVFDEHLSASVKMGSGRKTETDSDNETLSNTSSASLGVRKLFASGTEAQLSVATSGSKQEQSDTTSRQKSTTIEMSFTQSLLRGMGREVNLANIRKAHLNNRSSRYEFIGLVESIVAEIESTYFDYALALRKIEIFEQSLKLARDQERETMERVKVGKLAEIEVTAAATEVALRREALINAHSSLESTHLRLIRLLSPQNSSQWQRKVILSDPLKAPEVMPLDDVASHVELALKKRPDLHEARLGIERGELDLVRTGNGLLPKMDFFISLGKTNYAESFSGSSGINRESSFDISASLSLDLPLRNRSARSSNRRTQLTQKQRHDSLRNLTQLIEMDVRIAYIEVTRTMKQIPATEATLKLQEEKLRAETAKFRVGKSTSLLVAGAARDLLASRINNTEAVVKYQKALINLYRLEGSLLQRRGIILFGDNN